ncbi:hypothetical protein Tco_0095444, partial [Tanacetum coccineum]
VVVSGVPGDGSRVHTHDHDRFEAPDESPDSILSSEPKPLRKHKPPPPPSILSPGEHPDDGDKGGECAGGAVHLARRSPAKGGDSDIGGDGDGVVIVRSLSTSASGGRDMEVWGRTVILAPIVMSVEGGGITGSVPSGGKTSSSTGRAEQIDR